MTFILTINFLLDDFYNTGKGGRYVGNWTFKNSNPNYLGLFSLSNPLFSPTIPWWKTAGIVNFLCVILQAALETAS